jgi:hypothetical protein
VKGLRTLVTLYNKNIKCSTDILPGVRLHSTEYYGDKMAILHFDHLRYTSFDVGSEKAMVFGIFSFMAINEK